MRAIEIELCSKGKQKYPDLYRQGTHVFITPDGEKHIRRFHAIDDNPLKVLVEAFSEYAKHCVYIANGYGMELVDHRDDSKERDVWPYYDVYDLETFTDEQKARLPLGIEEEMKQWELSIDLQDSDCLSIFLDEQGAGKLETLASRKLNTIEKIAERALYFLQSQRDQFQKEYKARYIDHDGNYLYL